MKRRQPCATFTFPNGTSVALKGTAHPFVCVLFTPDHKPCAILPCRTAGAALRRAEAMRGAALIHNPLTETWERLTDEETAP